MMGFLKYLRKAILAASLPVLAAVPSCGLIYDEGNGEDIAPAAESVEVGFHIELGSPSSKATPEGDYDDGTGSAYENYIDLLNGGFCMLFFDAENCTYLDSFVPKEILPLGDGVYSKRYEVTGSVGSRLPESFRVAVLANWDACPGDLVKGQTTMDEICTGSSSIYRYTVPFTLSADRLVPMYGVKLCEGMVFREGMMTYLGTIHLLRAMAKVEVAMDSASPLDWTLDKVQLRHYNTSGFSAPYGVYGEDDYVKGSYEQDYTADLHIVPDVSRDALLDFSRKDDGSFVIYVPEYLNSRDGEKLDDASSISVTFNENPGKVYAVEFRYYTNAPSAAEAGSYFDIRRNYYYRFRISKSEEFADPVVSVDVIPYSVVSLSPEYGLWVDDEGNKVDAQGNIVITGKDGYIIVRIAPDGTITDRDGNLIELDENLQYTCTDADGNVIWTIEKVSDNRYSVRDADGFLIASAYLKN